MAVMSEADWKDAALVTFSAAVSAAFSGYPTTAYILVFAAMMLLAYYPWRQDELEVFGS